MFPDMFFTLILCKQVFLLFGKEPFIFVRFIVNNSNLLENQKRN